ncbi:MAG: ATP-binding protein [Chloroflexi bacterium]|nr:ATP-binding protein [Chloroflexota bacterium]
MTNPFRYGKVVSGEYFTDREGELTEIESDVLNGQDLVVISPRRYGKTSLVLQAAEHLRKRDVLVAYIDLFRSPAKDKLAERLAAAIHEGLIPTHERMLQRAADFFSSLPVRPKIVLKPDGSYSFEFDASPVTRDIDRTIEGLLEILAKVASDRKRRVALILDEFQEVMSIDPALPGVMRSIFQNQNDVSHVFLGSKRHLMESLFSHKSEALYRMAKPVRLREIAEEDFSAFIGERFRASGRRIVPEAIGRILAITERHPHDTQELCYFAWAIADAEGVAVTPEVVEQALSQVLDAEDARCKELWDKLSPHRRLVLIALAIGNGEGVFSQAYRLKNGLGPASTVQKSLKYLIQEDIVEASPKGKYRLSDTFLRKWVAQLASS